MQFLERLFSKKINQLEAELKAANNAIVDKSNKMHLLEQKNKKLEKEKKDFYLAQMRLYLGKAVEKPLAECDELIETDEGLKHFGMLWGRYKVDTMLIFTALEQNFIHNYDFTESELKVLRHVIGNLGAFFYSCKELHQQKESERAKRSR